MAGPSPDYQSGPPGGHRPGGTTELGIDIIKVDHIRASIEHFGARFAEAAA